MKITADHLLCRAILRLRSGQGSTTTLCKFKLAAILTTLILLSSLPSCAKKAAEVGDIPITDKDVKYRAQVAEVYYPGSGEEYVGLTQLIKGYLAETVLESLGHRVDRDVLEQEAKRIDENTQAAAVLEKVKSVFATNRKAYLNTFVRVVYAERVLYNEVFLNTKRIHHKEWKKVNSFLQKAVLFPGLFTKAAEESGLEVRKLVVSPTHGIYPYGENPDEHSPPGASSGLAERIINLISSLEPGQVYEEIIVWLEGFEAIKFVGKEGEDFIVESVRVPKRPYDDWFWEQAGVIPVQINDKKLKAEFVEKVGWGKQLNLVE